MAGMFTENASAIFKISLIGLAKERIERFKLFCTSVHSCHDTGHHEFESFQLVLRTSSLSEIVRHVAKYVEHSF